MQKKSTFAFSDFVLLLVCHIGRLALNKNAKKPFVAICFGFREKIARSSLTGLNGQLLKEGSSIPHMRKNYIVASPGSVSISVRFFFFFFFFFCR